MEEVTLRGQPIHLSGPLPLVGARAPAFTLATKEFKECSLSDFGKKSKLLNIFPSLDTPTCSKSVHAFYKKLSALPNLTVVNISVDLPSAASRFCQQEQLTDAVTLSAFRSTFPEEYGVRIVDGVLRGLCARAVLLLDAENIVRYREVIGEITQEPNYQAVVDLLAGLPSQTAPRR